MIENKYNDYKYNKPWKFQCKYIFFKNQEDYIMYSVGGLQ